jgi:hypothetical protein
VDKIPLTSEDLRAGVAAGYLTEAQASAVAALAHDRAGRRMALPAEDEPFEFFRGFAEIFVAVGLGILFAAVVLLVGALGGGGRVVLLVSAACAAMAWGGAEYFTLKRRMMLPSIVLVCIFGGAIFLLSPLFFFRAGDHGGIALSALATAGALGLWYRRFRLPFTMFVLGVAVLMALYALTSGIAGARAVSTSFHGLIFDLQRSPLFSMTTLVFGIMAFAAGIWFDSRDPYRLGRHSATGFWLHLLAAPALVNTVAMTLFNMGGTVGVLSTAAALLVVTMIALIIDRRSFLTAGIVYFALIIAWLVQGGQQGGGPVHKAVVLLLLGILITSLGTWWTALRAQVMSALPAFPGKDRLPPYAETE